MTQVTLEQLTKVYEGKGEAAVDRLSLAIPSGKLTALLGPSGSGKTTTMQMIGGLIAPTAGDIRFDGRSVLGVPAERRGAVMVFQNYLLFPYMSVGDNVGFGLKMRGVDKRTIRRRVSEMLERVQLPGIERSKPRQLSGGQQQRVALARALIVEPEVLLLDEPLSNLDAHLRDEMRELIRGIQREMGITTILVTHDQEEAVVLADQIALMFEGRLHQYAEPSAFYETPVSVRVARFFGGANFIGGVYREGVMHTSIGDFRVMRENLAVGSGTAVLTVRPEAIVIGEGENAVSGTVVGSLYGGRYGRLTVDVGDERLVIVTPPGQMPEVGATITVCLPADQVWVVT